MAALGKSFDQESWSKLSLTIVCGTSVCPTNCFDNSEKDISKVRKQTSNPSLVPPAITACAWSGDYVGWKGETELMWFLKDLCGSSSGQSFEELKRCVAEKSYALNETVDAEEVGVLTSQGTTFKPVHPSHWNSSLTATLLGTCHTLVYPELIDKGSHRFKKNGIL